MNFPLFPLARAACLAACCAAAAPTWAIQIAGTHYAPAGPTETLVAEFSAAAGAVTAHDYQGLVLLHISGTGYSLGPRLNDAFHLFTGGPVEHPGSFYQLVATRSGTVQGGGNAGVNDNAYQFIVYDADAATPVSRPHVPAYRADHRYQVVIDTRLLSGASSRLRFGVNDGHYGDNGGHYQIGITPLAVQSPVPEPATALLLLAGLSAAALRRQRTAA